MKFMASWCSRLARQPVTLEVDGSSPFEVTKSTKYFLQRIDGTDTDSAVDWVEIRIIPGQTQNPLEVDKYTATVTPFLFPDSGGIPIYQALEKAQESVFIEMYELRSPNIYALLIQLEERGTRRV